MVKFFGAGPILSSHLEGNRLCTSCLEMNGATDPLGGMDRDNPGGGGQDEGECLRHHLRTQTCVSNNLLYSKY